MSKLQRRLAAGLRTRAVWGTVQFAGAPCRSQPLANAPARARGPQRGLRPSLPSAMLKAMSSKLSSALRSDFIAGLAVLLPAIVSIAVVVWLFGTVSNITDMLLFAVPSDWKYVGGAPGDLHRYWRLAALLLAIALVTLIGRLTRHYLGRKLVRLADDLLLRVPLVNKIYSTVKQVKEAFVGNTSSFQQAVLVQFPRAGMYSLGFITSDQRNEVQFKTPQNVWSVFVPTTPNPTSGFLVYVPEEELNPPRNVGRRRHQEHHQPRLRGPGIHRHRRQEPAAQGPSGSLAA